MQKALIITIFLGLPFFNCRTEIPNGSLPPGSLLEELSQEEPLKMTLEFDIGQLLANKRSEDFLPATLNYEKQNKERTWKLKVRTRGKFRLMNCDFPPLSLEFSKKDLLAAGLKDYDELKLTTHCLSDPRISRELVLREYLVYKLYNELTDKSFRVQLVKVTYKDTAKKIRDVIRFGFLVESTDELAARLDGQEVEQYGTTRDQLDREQESLVSVFQFMIGNTDWDIAAARNVKLIRRDSLSPIIPAPYDFDFCGLVAAPYALPKEEFGQRHIRQRIFLGMADSEGELRPALEVLRTKKDPLLSIVKDFRLLDLESRMDISTYIKDYYEMLEEEGGTLLTFRPQKS